MTETPVEKEKDDALPRIQYRGEQDLCLCCSDSREREREKEQVALDWM